MGLGYLLFKTVIALRNYSGLHHRLSDIDIIATYITSYSKLKGRETWQKIFLQIHHCIN